MSHLLEKVILTELAIILDAGSDKAAEGRDVEGLRLAMVLEAMAAKARSLARTVPG